MSSDKNDQIENNSPLVSGVMDFAEIFATELAHLGKIEGSLEVVEASGPEAPKEPPVDQSNESTETDVAALERIQQQLSKSLDHLEAIANGIEDQDDDNDPDLALDYDDDDFDPGSSSSGDDFLAKILINLMGDYVPSNGFDTLIRDITNRLGKNIYHHEWIQDYYNKLNTFKRANPENKFVFPREVFTRDEIRAYARQAAEKAGNLDLPITPACAMLADVLELSKTETLFLQFALKLSTNISYEFAPVFDGFRYSELSDDPAKIFASLFRITEEEVKTAQKGFLIQSGLLTAQESRFKPFYCINSDMRDAFCQRNVTLESLTEHLFPSNLECELDISTYEHLEKEIKYAERVIQKGLDEKKRGINLMFWGEPGTGKTQLALLLAKKNNWQLRIIGDISDADNKEKSRAERLVSLKIAQKLYGRDSNTILLFDETEDLFKTDNNAQFSKAFINRIIETTNVPIIWTTNDLEVLGNAVLRRMIYNIPFEIPPVSARRRIWGKYNEQYALKVKDDVLDDLADTYDTAPALIHNATKIASMAGLESDDLPNIVQSLDRLVHYGEKRKFQERVKQSDLYDLTCVNTETDIVGLTKCLMTAKPEFSLLLYGAPGTGKSEYGRHIAKKLDKKVLLKRASDLMSMWVGGTEELIAEAFEQAKDTESVLIIDEGDSFLRDRTKAERSWEVTQVNEMLSQMERHTQPFVLTTNLMRDLDVAAMRRFTFKMKFDFLRPDQSVKLFKTYFGKKAPVAIERMETLAPGDFKVVKQKADIMGIKDPSKLLDMLVEECELKPQQAIRIGF